MPLGSNNTSVGRRGSEGIPARSSSSTCGSCFTSFVSKETDACCVRRRIVIGKKCRNQTPGYLFAGDKNRQLHLFHFPDALRHPGRSTAMPFFVTVICTSGFRADFTLSRRSAVLNFERPREYDAHAGRNHGRAVKLSCAATRGDLLSPAQTWLFHAYTVNVFLRIVRDAVNILLHFSRMHCAAMRRWALVFLNSTFMKTPDHETSSCPLTFFTDFHQDLRTGP